MPAPETVKQLVKRFDEHRESYRAGKYNETQLRREVASTDRGIDKLVYELSPKGDDIWVDGRRDKDCGGRLTGDEVKVVEG